MLLRCWTPIQIQLPGQLGFNHIKNTKCKSIHPAQWYPEDPSISVISWIEAVFLVWNDPVGLRGCVEIQASGQLDIEIPKERREVAELWIYVSLFMHTYNQRLPTTFHFYFSSFDTLTTRYICTLNAKSVIANLNILHGQYFSLFSCNLSTVRQATRVLLKRVLEHLTEPHIRDLLFRFLLDPLMDEFLCNAQTRLVELNAMRDKSTNY